MKWKRNHETVNHAMNFERNGDDTSEKLANGCVHCAKGDATNEDNELAMRIVCRLRLCSQKKLNSFAVWQQFCKLSDKLLCCGLAMRCRILNKAYQNHIFIHPQNRPFRSYILYLDRDTTIAYTLCY